MQCNSCIMMVKVGVNGLSVLSRSVVSANSVQLYVFCDSLEFVCREEKGSHRTHDHYI
jgi:hypothetical protein